VAIGLVLLLAALGLQLDPLFGTPDSVGRVPAGGSETTVGRAAPYEVPQTVSVAGSDINAPVLPVGVREGLLEVPDDGGVLGWWRDGAVPAARSGTVVIAGHVDTPSGPGALYRLESVVPGQEITLGTALEPMTYRVEARQAYRKGRLPADLFTTDGPARLALVTCGGEFDRATGTYEYNVVVYAVPA
jgi:hypothetical protein